MPARWNWSRRDFLRSVLAAAGWRAVQGGDEGARRTSPIPRRNLGRTGIQVGILGLGAFPLGGLGSEEDALRIVGRMLEAGVNYLDTAPSYGDGASETRVGKAIRGRRDKVILATKTLGRRREDAIRDLEGSLGRLGTDHVDIWQVHSITSHEDLDRVLGDDGPVRAGEDAVRAGKARFIGVTGHVHPDLNLRAIREHPFDTILMPLNAADPRHLSFVRDVLPLAVQKNLGVIAMKVLASGKLPGRYGLTAADCIRYAMSLPVSCATVGISSLDQAEAALDAARQPPLSEEGVAELEARVRDHPGRALSRYRQHGLYRV